MDLAISEDKQDVIEGLLKVKFYRLCDLIQDVREVGRSREGDLGQVLSINLSDTCCPVDLRV